MWKSLLGVFLGGWTELLGASLGCFPVASLAFFLPKTSEILGAGCRRLSLPGVKASPGR